MVFWKTYPWRQWIQSMCSVEQFTDLVFDKEAFSSPTENHAELLTGSASFGHRTMIRQFLKTYFGSPPHTPILDIPEKNLVGKHDYLFYVNDHHQKIIGCVRYHYMGQFLTEATQPMMYVVDCFCIHPQWRKKGVGDYLLTILHRFANNKGIPYCLFLKEGPSLSILHTPLYSSRYVFTRALPSFQTNVSCISTKEAYRMMDLFQELNPDLCIIRNQEESSNQYWRLYKKGHVTILACVQSSFQYFIENDVKQRMGWITAWLQTPNTTPSIQGEASEQIVDSMRGIVEYVWGNEDWIGDSGRWKADGVCHWYTYQWTTNINIKTNYCLLH